MQPRIAEWQSQYKFQLVIVSTDTPEELKNFMNKNKIQATVLVDSQMNANRLYKIQGIPADYLINSQGAVEHSFLGWSGSTSLKTIEDWLKTS